jgi:hypothetical protein
MNDLIKTNVNEVKIRVKMELTVRSLTIRDVLETLAERVLSRQFMKVPHLALLHKHYLVITLQFLNSSKFTVH